MIFYAQRQANPAPARAERKTEIQMMRQRIPAKDEPRYQLAGSLGEARSAYRAQLAWSLFVAMAVAVVALHEVMSPRPGPRGPASIPQSVMTGIPIPGVAVSQQETP